MSLLSIVTPCLNRASTIREAIESAMHQDYTPVEHVVMDGGSTDGTLEILKNYPHLRVISEPDRNLFDALNKGISHARGEIIGQLNTDDLYEPNIFKTVMQYFETHPEIDALVGGADVFEEDGTGTRKLLVTYPAPQLKDAFECVTTGVPLFNAWFFRKTVFEKLGGYDIQFRLTADRNLLIHFFLQGGRWARMDGVYYHYRKHLDSLTFSGQDKMAEASREEYFKISESYIRENSANPEFISACRAWHLRDTVEYCVRSLYLKNYGKAFYYARRGMKMERTWPSALWNRLSPTLWRRLGFHPGGEKHA
jgi:glycosyltransferase involved in cell wall biosynthesis